MGLRWYYPKVSEFLSSDPLAGTADPKTSIDRTRWLYGGGDPLTALFASISGCRLSRGCCLENAAQDAPQFSVSAKRLFGAAGNWAKFAQGVDARAAIQEAITSPVRILMGNAGRGDSFRVITDLGRTIGSASETGIRTVIGIDGKIWTAFPVNI